MIASMDELEIVDKFAKYFYTTSSNTSELFSDARRICYQAYCLIGLFKRFGIYFAEIG